MNYSEIIEKAQNEALREPFISSDMLDAINEGGVLLVKNSNEWFLIWPSEEDFHAEIVPVSGEDFDDVISMIHMAREHYVQGYKDANHLWIEALSKYGNNSEPSIDLQEAPNISLQPSQWEKVAENIWESQTIPKPLSKPRPIKKETKWIWESFFEKTCPHCGSSVVKGICLNDEKCREWQNEKQAEVQLGRK